MAGWRRVMKVGPASVLVLLALGGPACFKRHTVYLEDELPLAAPEEGPAAATGDVVDPPTRVARVGDQSGPVGLRQGGSETWAPALRNLPLTDGDALWSGPGARTELQVGSTRLRLSEATSLALFRINDRFFQVGLDQGGLIVHILPGELTDSAEIDTPAGSVNLTEAGTYRIDMDASLPTGSVTVRSGRARISLEGEVIEVGPGQRVLLTHGDTPSYLVEQAPAPDAFEAWSEGRDQAAALSWSTRKLGKDVMGAADLDGAGTWQVHPQYGDVWLPRVAPGWAPYRMGRWTWIAPWGWTWVDDAPWGFAPSHYGRWTQVAGAWAWAPRDPGATPSRPVYAPALVAFAGQPTGWGSQPKMHGGGIAWFPLGPREAYTPTYPATRTYTNGLNAWAAPGPRKTWANLTVPGALTAVPRATFTSFASVATAAVPILKAAQFQKAPVGGTPALAPSPRSFPTDPAATRPPAGLRERPLVARSPLPAPPPSLATRVALIQAGHGLPRPLPAGPGPARARPWVNAVAPTRDTPLRNLALPLPAPPREERAQRAAQAPARPSPPAKIAAPAPPRKARARTGARPGARAGSKARSGATQDVGKNRR